MALDLFWWPTAGDDSPVHVAGAVRVLELLEPTADRAVASAVKVRWKDAGPKRLPVCDEDGSDGPVRVDDLADGPQHVRLVALVQEGG